MDPAKLNGVLTAVAEGVRGRGAVIGETTTDANQVLREVNPRSDTIRADTRAASGFTDTYSAAAHDILKMLDASAVTSATIPMIRRRWARCSTAIGLSNSGIRLVGPNKDNFIKAVSLLDPTTSLLMKYNPALTCMLVGARPRSIRAISTPPVAPTDIR